MKKHPCYNSLSWLERTGVQWIQMLNSLCCPWVLFSGIYMQSTPKRKTSIPKTCQCGSSVLPTTLMACTDCWRFGECSCQQRRIPGMTVQYMLIQRVKARERQRADLRKERPSLQKKIRTQSRGPLRKWYIIDNMLTTNYCLQA